MSILRNKKTIYVIIAVLVLIGITCYVYIQFCKNKINKTVIETPETEWGSPELARQEAEKSSFELSQTSQRYSDPELSLSFDYPKTFEISAFTETEGEEAGDRTILVQDVSKNIGIQITAMSFLDPVLSLSEDRIETDLGIDITNYVPINIGKKQNVQAITFVSGDTVKSREVWFVNNETLFIVKAYQSSESLVVAILKTLEI